MDNVFRYRPSLTLLKSMDKSVKIQSDRFSDSASLDYMMDRYYIDIPLEFKGHEIWSAYMSEVRDQGSCGACWAFSSVGTLPDRFSILTKGQLKIEMSVAKVILCDWGGDSKKAYPFFTQKLKSDIKDKYKYEVGCNGNSIQSALNYLYRYGTTSEECVPYDLGDFPDISTGDSDSIPVCQTIVGKNQDQCITGKPMRVFRALSSYNIKNDVRSIQYDIMRWGPVLSAFLIYEDFYKYNPTSDGVYRHGGDSKFVTGHAVEIVGWGGDNNGGWWWIKNTWGKDWGEDGYFRCEMMNPLLQLEENAMGCIPDIPTIPSISIMQYILPDFSIEKDQDKKVRDRYKVHESSYPLTVVNKVLNGTIFGVDLSPIVISSKIPDFSVTSAYQIGENEFIGNISNYQDPPIVFNIPEYKPIPNKIKEIQKEYKKNRIGFSTSYSDSDSRNYNTLSDTVKRGDTQWLVICIISFVVLVIYWLLVDFKLLKRLKDVK